MVQDTIWPISSKTKLPANSQHSAKSIIWGSLLVFKICNNRSRIIIKYGDLACWVWFKGKDFFPFSPVRQHFKNLSFAIVGILFSPPLLLNSLNTHKLIIFCTRHYFLYLIFDRTFCKCSVFWCDILWKIVWSRCKYNQVQCQ